MPRIYATLPRHSHTLLEVKVMWGFRQSGGYPHMHELDLEGCELLTDVSLSWVAAGCKPVGF